uniref:Nectin cell adhesion molecule 3 n=1 Tax=Denticeps clupeoides TaxID=299321 RepID=A0AAY4B289_9TELE
AAFTFTAFTRRPDPVVTGTVPPWRHSGLSVAGSRLHVPPKVNAVLGKNITLGCRVELDANLTLTQSSWERQLPSGAVTLAVFNPQFGISITPEYVSRVSFTSPSVQDASIRLEGVAFPDVGVYTCKVATFPLGNTQSSTTVDILVEPKVYVASGVAPLLDAGNETTVATCVAERGRPEAEVHWESESVHGQTELQKREEHDGITTSQMRFVWSPTRHAQGHALTCVVRHPALPGEVRLPYVLNVLFAPDVMVVGYDSNWFSGQEGTRLDYPARCTLVFKRRLQHGDSGVYRCEVQNEVGTIRIASRFPRSPPQTRNPPPTTTVSTTSAAASRSRSSTSGPPRNHRSQLSSPTLASLSDSGLGTVVGGAVGGVLFLVLLLVLGGTCYARRHRTFRGDYYTKQYLGPADMQKQSQLDVLQPHELQEVYGGGGGGSANGSQDLKPKPAGDVIYDPHPGHAHSTNNGSPYLPEDCYDNGTDGDYVSHVDGSVISRREWYV